MQAKKSGAFLLSGVAMVAMMSSLQVAHGADEVQETIIATACLEGGKGIKGVSFDWRVDGKVLVLNKIITSELPDEENPNGLIKLGIVVPGWWEGKSVRIKEGAFSGLNAPNTFRLHLVFKEENGQRVMMPKDCSHMFEDSHSIVSIDFSGADVSHVTSMANMFANCTRLSTLDLRTFNLETDDSERIHGIIKDCAGLMKVMISKITRDPKETLTTMLGEEVDINKNDGNIINVANKNNFINFDVIVDKNTLRRNDENATTNENPTMSSSESENVQTPNHRTTQTKRVSNLEEHNQPKDKHEKDAKTMPIDVHQVKHKKPWYTPIVRLCSWVKCKVLSWFGY